MEYKLRIFKTIFIGLICLSLIIALIPRIKVITDLNSRKQALLQQKAELERKQEILKQNLDQAESLFTIEKIAREQLGMVKNGERVVVPVIPDTYKSDKRWN